MRKTPNIDSLDIVLQTLEPLVSDDNTIRNVKVKRKNNVLGTREEEDRDKKGRQCFFCDKRHKYSLAECTYTCQPQER